MIDTATGDLPNHNCGLLYRETCETCETYFWGHVARHNEDEAGLERFLEARQELVQDKEIEKVGRLAKYQKESMDMICKAFGF